jgi:hypothetical protein
MDVRELAIMHKGARQLLVEQKMENLYHLRLAQAEGTYYSDEIRRLEGELWRLEVRTGAPRRKITPEEAARNRRELAAVMGLKKKK